VQQDKSSDSLGPFFILGIAGCAKSGKTTCADELIKWLTERHGDDINVQKHMFAAPLKNAMTSMGIHKETNEPLYREMAQTVGEIGRRFDPYFWVRQAEAQFESARDGRPTAVIVDDVRYPNEVQSIRSLGGMLCLVRPGRRIDTSDQVYKHESERMAIEVYEGKRRMSFDYDIQAQTLKLDRNQLLDPRIAIEVALGLHANG